MLHGALAEVERGPPRPPVGGSSGGGAPEWRRRPLRRGPQDSMGGTLAPDVLRGARRVLRKARTGLVAGSARRPPMHHPYDQSRQEGRQGAPSPPPAPPRSSTPSPGARSAPTSVTTLTLRAQRSAKARPPRAHRGGALPPRGLWPRAGRRGVACLPGQALRPLGGVRRKARAENRTRKAKGLRPVPFVKPMLWILAVAFSEPMCASSR